MGVEWDIGCERCRHFVWLGSQKPYKWAGFQLGDDEVRSFLALHTGDRGCQLRLTNDGTTAVAWEDGAPSGWREDILSRSFWDSRSEAGLICAQCEAADPGLHKNQLLAFCGEPCFEAYRAAQLERDHSIHDSSSERVALAPGMQLSLACLDCRAYLIVDDQPDVHGVTRDMQYLALFACEHIGPHRLLALYIDPDSEDPSLPWHGPDAASWQIHVD